jgi:hypothetical protein
MELVYTIRYTVDPADTNMREILDELSQYGDATIADVEVKK